MTEPIKLWTAGDIARQVGIATSSVHQWFSQPGWCPTPYAIAGGNNQRLFTDEQVKKIVIDYQARLRSRSVGGKNGGKNGVVTDFVLDAMTKPRAKRVEIPKRTTIECSDCHQHVFDLEMHQQFFHKGKYSIVGPRYPR